MSEHTADVVIVGGGVIGCSIAWHLTRAGVSDIVILEKGTLAGGATGICPGGIRQQFEGEADCRWAQHSVRFWERINEILEPDHPFDFERSGYLFVAHGPGLLHRLKGNVERQNALGIPSEVLGPDDINAMLPALRTEEIWGGAFCREDGFIEDAHGVTHLLARRAEEAGARVLFEEAAALSREGSSWAVGTRPAGSQADTGALGAASGGAIHCDKVILAAGVDSVPLAATVGLELPIVAQRRRLAFTLPHDDIVMPPLVIAPEVAFAGKQLTSGGFYIGWLAESGDEPELVFTEKALRAGLNLWSGFDELPVRRVLAGFYDTTPDRRPILGGVPGLDNLSFAVGFSGHGFMLAPAVGEALTGWVTGDPVDLPEEPFAWARFEGGRPDDEGMVF